MPTTAPVDTLNPPLTPWPASPGLVPLDIARADHPVRVVGMTTGVPGLTITPALLGTVTFTGGWTLTHHVSGRQIVPGLHDLPLAYSAEAARLLRQPDSGYWTQPATVITTDRAMRRTVADLALLVDRAATGNRPIQWARDSWQVITASGDTDQWSLYCAAPLCTTGPADGPSCVHAWDDVSPLIRPDQAIVATNAESQQWRQHDKQHWLCPDCATAHHATHRAR